MLDPLRDPLRASGANVIRDFGLSRSEIRETVRSRNAFFVTCQVPRNKPDRRCQRYSVFGPTKKYILQTKSDRYGQTAQNRTLYCTLTLSTLYGRLSAVYARKFAIDCPHSAPAPLGRARAGSAPGQQRIHWSATIGVHRPLGLGYRLVRARGRD